MANRQQVEGYEFWNLERERNSPYTRENAKETDKDQVERHSQLPMMSLMSPDMVREIERARKKKIDWERNIGLFGQ